MNLGAEPKKVKALIGLLLFGGGYSFYSNFLSGPDVPAGAQKGGVGQGQQSAPTPAQESTKQRMQQRKMILGQQSVGAFVPSVKFGKDNRPDPMRVDPTLRLDLLAKLQKVTLEGGQRSLFEMGKPPAPPPVKGGPGETIKVGGIGGKGVTPAVDPLAAGAAKPPPPVKPPPPPIPLKFYGFTALKAGGAKRAFFLEGEDIYVVNEGDLIKRRYKIVRIGLTSVVVEDTEVKHQQTLPLEEPPVTG